MGKEVIDIQLWWVGKVYWKSEKIYRTLISLSSTKKAFAKQDYAEAFRNRNSEEQKALGWDHT